MVLIIYEKREHTYPVRVLGQLLQTNDGIPSQVSFVLKGAKLRSLFIWLTENVTSDRTATGFAICGTVPAEQVESMKID